MDRRAAAKFNLDAIKTLEAFAGKARQSIPDNRWMEECLNNSSRNGI